MLQNSLETDNSKAIPEAVFNEWPLKGSDDAFISKTLKATTVYMYLIATACYPCTDIFQGLYVFAPILPFLFLIVLAIVIWKKSSCQIFENHPCLYMLTFGLVNTKITSKLIVSITI